MPVTFRLRARGRPPVSWPSPVSLPSGQPASRYQVRVELYVQRETRPREAFAARYRSGQPPGELEAVARRAGDVEMTGIPHWCCLLVRTWPENAEPAYHVVADGHWLVFDMSHRVLCTLTGEQFSGEFQPAASPAAP